MVLNWAELKFGGRLIRLAQNARSRVRARHPELEAQLYAQDRKDWVWRTLTDSSFSNLAWTTGLFLGICIALSTIAFILETVPDYERSSQWAKYSFYAEWFFVIVFSMEIGLKFWSTPQTTQQFFMDALNVIDILSILPFYIELFLVVFVGSGVAMWDLRVLRALRLMRMMKMGRFSDDLQILAEGLFRARISIAMLFGTLILGTVFFSVFLWTTERGSWNASLQCYARSDEVNYNGCSPFASVPLSFWWAATTMTTVGYGDAFPVTPIGRCIGGLAMLAGIFCVALPTGVLCAEFTKLYEERSHCQKEFRITAELQMRPKAELELFLAVEKIADSKKELEEQLIYMNRLAHIYNDSIKIDPMYTSFQNQAGTAIDAIKDLIISVSHDLLVIPAHVATLTGLHEIVRERSRSSVATSPGP